MRTQLGIAAVIGFLAFGAGAAAVWTGEEDGWWANPSNWSPQPPGVEDSVVIDGGKNGAVISNSNVKVAAISLGSVSGADGHLTFDCPDGALVASGAFNVGEAKDASGTFVMNASSLTATSGVFVVGVSGHGIYTNLQGSVTCHKSSAFANGAGSRADIVFKGGSLSLSGGELKFGVGGTAVATVDGGTMTGRGIVLGSNAGGVGVVTVNAGGTLKTSENWAVCVGRSGTGIMRLRGGEITRANSSAPLVVREYGSGYGLLTGWGVIDINASKGSSINNNGLVIADGRGEDGVAADRMLKITKQQNSMTNSIENDSTNGWYAINRGVLSLEHSVTNLAVGEERSCTWGEDPFDDEIDLVNSARITYRNVTKEITGLTGLLYAPDHGDVPGGFAPGRNVVGIWKFNTVGTFETADVELRYDHVRAHRGVVMYAYNGRGWKRLESELLPNHRVKVRGVDLSQMLAAAEFKVGTCLKIR